MGIEINKAVLNRFVRLNKDRIVWIQYVSSTFHKIIEIIDSTVRITNESRRTVTVRIATAYFHLLTGYLTDCLPQNTLKKIQLYVKVSTHRSLL